jgi:hypothetical protein
MIECYGMEEGEEEEEEERGRGRGREVNVREIGSE